MGETRERIRENLEAWIRDLETTDATQGRGALRTANDEFCCLGRGACVLGVKWQRGWDNKYAIRDECDSMEQNELPEFLCDRLGIEYNKDDSTLVWMNDTAVQTPLPREGPARMREAALCAHHAARTLHLTQEEAKRLVEALPAPYKALHALMLATGMEWAAAIAVRPEDIGERQVYAAGTKRAHRRRTVGVYDKWLWAWDVFLGETGPRGTFSGSLRSGGGTMSAPCVKECTCGGPMVANFSHGEPVSYRCYRCDHHQIVGFNDHLVASPVKGYGRCTECRALVGGLSTHWGWCSHSEQSAAICAQGAPK